MATTASERKSFFKRIGGKNKPEEESEMTFFDHIEELRWHLVRSIIAWLVAAIAIFIYIDWIYDNVILAPANEERRIVADIAGDFQARFGRWPETWSTRASAGVKREAIPA